jgi:hypothetical protein
MKRNQILILLLGAVVVLAIGSYYHMENNNLMGNNIMDNADGQNPQSNYVYATLGNDWSKANDHWQIRLAEIISDDRCPETESCDSPGKAVVKVQLQEFNVDYSRAYFETLEVSGHNQGQLQAVTIPRKDAITGQEVGIKIALADLQKKDNNFTAAFYIEELK